MKTRQYILEAAERMIQAKGLARLTNKEIAQEAGCAEGTLYKHFATKDELILAAVSEHLPTFLAAIDDDRVGQHSIEENLWDIAQAVIKYYEKLMPLSTALYADMELLNKFRQWMQEQQVGPMSAYERVAAYIEAEQKIGRLDQNIHPFSFAALLLGSCFQYVFVRSFQGYDPYPVSEQQFIAGIVQTLLKGGNSYE